MEELKKTPLEEWQEMSTNQRRKKLCREIVSAIILEIHGNVCYLLNYCDFPQETADELCVHYNAIKTIIENFENQFEAKNAAV